MDSPVAKHLIDTRAARIFEGTDEIMELKVAAAVLGKEFGAYSQVKNGKIVHFRDHWYSITMARQVGWPAPASQNISHGRKAKTK